MRFFLLDYDDNSKANTFLNPTTKKIVISCDAEHIFIKQQDEHQV